MNGWEGNNRNEQEYLPFADNKIALKGPNREASLF